ncbi:MAG TPA: nucleotidyltransferase substrate binding protein [Verrucomicrobiae bacterium]|jgi:nucleotidyltransferase substrate binding protein (TIGR01987 family)|nr:nucleotidyltransferase substrate binding protein [Verrucomicrobiae bacterium]
MEAAIESYQKALRLLREALTRVDDLSDLEKEGTVQRFEFTVELAWKSMKDYLEEGGIVLDPVTPKNVIKEGFAAKVITDGQLWIDMIGFRNRLSHTYDEAVLDEAVREMSRRFLRGLEELETFFQKANVS